MDDTYSRHVDLRDVSLTQRELEVLSLKARRRTNAEIAEALFISVSTVKWHVRQIYNKLGVNNRTEAVATARQLGLLEKQQDLPGRPEQPHRNLPTPVTPFIGREHELHQLIEALTDSNTQLVTVIGPGGMGKTRLALQAAKMLHDHFADKPCWVNFSGQGQSELVFSTIEEYITATIITAIGLSLQGSTDPHHLLETYLYTHEILFILDSFEHLVMGANLISDLLAGNTASKFLVTSRERLDITGETLFPIGGMSIPQKNGDTPDAVNLFLQAASRVSKEDLTDQPTLAVIKRICQRLEGMPLAIELAADWTRLLSVNDIEHELDQGFEFLDTESTKMSAVFDHSWILLTEPQRDALARLAVFQDGFTRKAAHQVAKADLGILTNLFDKSLIQRSGGNRYSLHDLLHQYAAKKLVARGEQESTRNAHCAYFAKLIAEQKEPIYQGDHSEILPDLDNIRTAWQWAVKSSRFEDLRIMLWPLDWFYNLRAFYSEAMAAMKLVIDAFSSQEPEGLQGIVYGKALASYALEMARVQGVDQAIPLMRQALGILQHLGSDEDLAWPQLLSGFSEPDPSKREQKYLESLKIFEELDDPYGLAVAKGMILGSHYMEQGRYDDAQRSIEQSLVISRSLGDPEGEAATLRTLGHLNLHLGDYSAARKNFQDESKLWRGLSLTRLVGEAIHSVGETYLAEGDYKKAQQVFQRSLAEFEMVGDQGCTLVTQLALINIAWKQGKLAKAHKFLQDARQILDRRSDSWEEARWWQCSGRIATQQGDLVEAQLAYQKALDFSLKVGGSILADTLLDLTEIYLDQHNDIPAGRLLGYVQSQNGLPVSLIQGRIKPIQSLLALRISQDQLALLLEEGKIFNQQALVDQLFENPVSK